MKNKKDFVSKLMHHGTGFAMSFLVFVGLALAAVVFFIVLGIVSFFDRVLS